MDDRWESEVIEYGAINITGFRIVDDTRPYVKEFLENWRRQDPTVHLGSGRQSISVSIEKLNFFTEISLGTFIQSFCHF